MDRRSMISVDEASRLAIIRGLAHVDEVAGRTRLAKQVESARRLAFGGLAFGSVWGISSLLGTLAGLR